MLRVLTSEEELADRSKSYAQLARGKLFDLSGKRVFIAIEKHDDSIQVIELEAKNISRILRGELCVRSRLKFDEMKCLNIR